MDDRERDELIKNINDRTSPIEQILPTLATKRELDAFATKADVKSVLANHERRIASLEADRIKGR